MGIFDKPARPPSNAGGRKPSRSATPAPASPPKPGSGSASGPGSTSGSGRASGAPLVPGTLTSHDLHLWNEGSHFRMYRHLGAQLGEEAGVKGARFGVWAPNARRVSVFGDFNGWDKDSHVLEPVESSGIWSGFVPKAAKGQVYKYHIQSQHQGYQVDKADPFAARAEEPPRTGSVIWDHEYDWKDAAWMKTRAERNALGAPQSIYEVHVGSWRRPDDDQDRFLTYREMAKPLAEYTSWLGFTHVELMPIMEHPFYGSWGYQTTGYFAPSSRFGSPQDFMYLIDTLHEHGVGVILDWVPSHFPEDEHALGFFDGTHLFEHADPRQGFHPDWKSAVFNYGRKEVHSFLISSAMNWLDRYHIDGIRVDAVASMLYLDYSRKQGEWIPNKFGGRENLEAIEFLRRFNAEVYSAYPDVQTYAEESTAWPGVSRPVYLGGLGFGLKWDMGWMHDTLHYMQEDPVHRSYHHGELTFRMIYAFHENFTMPLSHDEVVYGKGSLLGKMPGDSWQQLANLRLLYAYMMSQPGKKLIFMGGDFGQLREWNHDASLDWHLTHSPGHAGIQHCLKDLNRVYRDQSALHALDTSEDGFEWIDGGDWKNSVLSYLRKDDKGNVVLVVLNFTPVVRENYRVGVPAGGYWREILNTDASDFGGSGVGNFGGCESNPVAAHGRYQSLNLTLPPLGALYLVPD